jgi:hypothetical protein
MKKYRQLVKELPSRTVVLAVEEFNPPTAKHEVQFKLINKIAESHNADQIVFVSESKDSLPVDRTIHFLNVMFGNQNYRPLKESVEDTIKKLESTYKKVIVIGNHTNLSESVQVIPTEDTSVKIKSIVSKGNIAEFKKLMPTSFRDLDTRLMMNEMRKVQGLDPIKEDVKFSIDQLRDKYFKGEIYHVGDIVESAGQEYEIMDRGSNYLVVVDKSGDLHRKWVKDVNLVEAVKKATDGLKNACWKGYTAVGTKKKNGGTVPNCVPEEVTEDTDPQVSYKGYTTKNFHHCSDTSKAFKMTVAKDVKDPVAMLNAIKTTDTYLKINDPEANKDQQTSRTNLRAAHIKAKEALVKVGEFETHAPHWEKHKKILDDILGESVENFSNNILNKNAVSYTAFMKAKKLNPWHVRDQKQIIQVIDPNISQQIDDLEDWPFEPQTEVGHTLETDRQLRRRKVMYATENTNPSSVATNKSRYSGDALKSFKQARDYTSKAKNVTKAHGTSAEPNDSASKNRIVMKEDSDIITFDIPLLILEMTRLEVDVEKLIAIRDKDTLTAEDYQLVSQLKEQYLPEGHGGEIGDGIGHDKIVKVKSLPPELAPKKDPKDVERTKDHSFSAFYEKTKKENVDFDFDQLVKRRLTKE